MSKNWYNQIDPEILNELDEPLQNVPFEKTKKKKHFDDGTTLKSNKKKRSKNRKANINKEI